MAVRIANKLSQVVHASVRGDDGQAKDVVILANGISDPIDETKLTTHTKSLIAAGHLRLRPA